MPYLTQKFIHEVSDTSGYNWDYKQNSNTIINMSYLKDRKGYTNFFYNDLKSLLEKTYLPITFDKDNFIFNIFGIDIMIKCFDTNSNGFENAIKYNGIKPYIILPRNSEVTDNSSYKIYNLVDSSWSYCWSTSTSSYGNSYVKYFSLIEFGENTYKNMHYNIKLWYNTNFIMCNIISAYGYESPLFCFIQGELVRDKTKKAIYLCSNINSYNSNYAYHSIVIPELNIDETKCINYIPGTSMKDCYNNYTDYITDDLYYPSEDTLSKLSSDGTPDDIYMQNFTSFGGIIRYDNVFNITRNNSNSLPRQFEKRRYYNINGNTYYYPGINNIMSDCPRQFIFKI